MMGRSRHLHDDHLIECYFADRSGEPLDPPSAEHLADCDACGARYAELAGFLNDLRTEADVESDAMFSADRLRQQQEHILRRIEHVSRSARVISFPGQTGSQYGAGTGRVAPRWLAAAAAAGLFVGVAVGGTVLQPGLRRSMPGMRVAGSQSAAARLAPVPAVRVSTPPVVVDTFDDDAFLMELEFALERPHTQELQPFDALTPHVREIGTENR
jgi:hypothetical protein